jgi:hypothetical protein
MFTAVLCFDYLYMCACCCSQYLAVEKELGLNRDHVNKNGKLYIYILYDILRSILHGIVLYRHINNMLQVHISFCAMTQCFGNVCSALQRYLRHLLIRCALV